MDSGEDGVDRLRGERDAIGSGSFGSRGVSYDVRVGRLGRIAFVLGGRRRCWRGKDEGLEEFSLRLLRMMTRRGSETVGLGCEVEGWESLSCKEAEGRGGSCWHLKLIRPDSTEE
jgi:hypothetical protein